MAANAAATVVTVLLNVAGALSLSHGRGWECASLLSPLATGQCPEGVPAAACVTAQRLLGGSPWSQEAKAAACRHLHNARKLALSQVSSEKPGRRAVRTDAQGNVEPYGPWEWEDFSGQPEDPNYEYVYDDSGPGHTVLEVDAKGTVKDARLDTKDADTITCKITASSVIASVRYAGEDITSHVVPQKSLDDVRVTKEVTFVKVPGAYLSISAADFDSQGSCRTSGIAVFCTEPTANDARNWMAFPSSGPLSRDAAHIQGLGNGWQKTCGATSELLKLEGVNQSVAVWAGDVRFAAFRWRTPFIEVEPEEFPRVANPSFEEGSTTPYYQYLKPTGWAAVGRTIYIRSGTEGFGAVTTAGDGGFYLLGLQHRGSLVGQIVDHHQPNKEYILTFWASSRPGFAEATLRVSIDSEQKALLRLKAGALQKFTLLYKPTKPLVRVEFRNVQADDDTQDQEEERTVLLDAVSVQKKVELIKCQLTVSGALDAVYYNGEDVTADVSNQEDFGTMAVTKEVTVKRKPGALLVVSASAPKSQAGSCANAGLAITCNGPDSETTTGWNSLSSVDVLTTDATRRQGLGFGWALPCDSTADLNLNASSYAKLWAGPTDHAAFRWRTPGGSNAEALELGGPVVSNPSFESGSITRTYEYSPVQGWNSKGNTVYIYSGNDGWGGAVAQHGTYFLGLRQAGASISQDVTGTTIGREYVLHFVASSRSGYPRATLAVRVDGEDKAKFNLVEGPLREFTVNFVAAKTTARVEILNDSPDGDRTAFVDFVTIEPKVTAAATVEVPLPVTPKVAETVSCSFTADGSIDSVYYAGKDITDHVTASSDLTNSKVTKSVTFGKVAGAYLVIQSTGRESAGSCKNSGMVVRCSEPTANALRGWETVTVKGNDPRHVQGLGSGWGAPCDSEADLTLEGDGKAAKIWAGRVRRAVFRWRTPGTGDDEDHMPKFANPSFEEEVDTPSYEYGRPVGWRTDGDTVFIRSGSAAWGKTEASENGGFYFLGLQGNGTSVGQLVDNHEVGKDYQVTFQAASRVGFPEAQLRVTVDGVEKAVIELEAGPLRKYAVTYNTSQSRAFIEFTNVGGGGDERTAFLDDVRVQLKADQVTCTFTVNSAIDTVYYDGKDITGDLTHQASLENWQVAKQVSFNAVAGAYLVVSGSQLNVAAGNCANSGFVVTCTNANANDPSNWLTYSSDSSVSSDEKHREGRGYGWSAPCPSTANMALRGEKSSVKLWAGETNFAAFRWRTPGWSKHVVVEEPGPEFANPSFDKGSDTKDYEYKHLDGWVTFGKTVYVHSGCPEWGAVSAQDGTYMAVLRGGARISQVVANHRANRPYLLKVWATAHDGCGEAKMTIAVDGTVVQTITLQAGPLRQYAIPYTVKAPNTVAKHVLRSAELEISNRGESHESFFIDGVDIEPEGQLIVDDLSELGEVVSSVSVGQEPSCPGDVAATPEASRSYSSILAGSTPSSALNSKQGWTAANKAAGEWVQLDLGAQTAVVGVALQGRADADEWVTKFTVRLSVDGENFVDLPREFEYDGSKNRETVGRVLFGREVRARYVRIVAQEFFGRASLRVDALTCQADCQGIEVNPAEDKRLYSSTFGGSSGSSAKSELGSESAWSAETSQAGEWMQMDLEAETDVVGVVVQGHANAEKWVSKYSLQYSVDGQAFTKIPGIWEYNGKIDAKSKAILPSTVRARYVRVVAEAWNGQISLRAGVLACQAECASSLRNVPETSRTYSSVLTVNGTKVATSSALDAAGSWTADTDEAGQWVQLDLGVEADVTGVVLQSGLSVAERVTSYTVDYSPDGRNFLPVGRTFTYSLTNGARHQVNFRQAVRARHVKITVQTFQGHVSLRAGVMVCQAQCTLVQRNLPEASRKYSSIRSESDIGTGYARSALDSAGAWTAGLDKAGEYVELKLGSVDDVAGLVMQGAANSKESVTRYTVEYSVNGQPFLPIAGEFDYSAHDSNEHQAILFPASVKADTVRVVVKDWQGHVSLRTAVLSCQVAPVEPPEPKAVRAIISARITALEPTNFVQSAKAVDAVIKAAAKVAGVDETDVNATLSVPEEARTVRLDASVLFKEPKALTKGQNYLNKVLELSGWNDALQELLPTNLSGVVVVRVPFNELVNNTLEIIMPPSAGDLAWSPENQPAAATTPAPEEPEPCHRHAPVCTTVELNPPDSARSYSSVYSDPNATNATEQSYAKSAIGSAGSWVAAQNEAGEWLQLDLGAATWVSGLVVQGSGSADEAVLKFTVKFSPDGLQWKDVDFQRDLEAPRTFEVFTEQYNRTDKAAVQFNKPVKAKLLRIVVKKWLSHISMRAGVLACEDITVSGSQWLVVSKPSAFSDSPEVVQAVKSAIADAAGVSASSVEVKMSVAKAAAPEADSAGREVAQADFKVTFAGVEADKAKAFRERLGFTHQLSEGLKGTVAGQLFPELRAVEVETPLGSEVPCKKEVTEAPTTAGATTTAVRGTTTPPAPVTTTSVQPVEVTAAAAPVAEPVTAAPAAPVADAATPAPAAAEPVTAAPTEVPVAEPVTAAPAAPVAEPATPAPVAAEPVTAAPAAAPVAEPTTPVPVAEEPVTAAPVAEPVTAAPTTVAPVAVDPVVAPEPVQVPANTMGAPVEQLAAALAQIAKATAAPMEAAPQLQPISQVLPQPMPNTLNLALRQPMYYAPDRAAYRAPVRPAYQAPVYGPAYGPAYAPEPQYQAPMELYSQQMPAAAYQQAPLMDNYGYR